MSPPAPGPDVPARDELAVEVAAELWPGRYVGDLLPHEWARVYREADRRLAGQAEGGPRRAGSLVLLALRCRSHDHLE